MGEGMSEYAGIPILGAVPVEQYPDIQFVQQCEDYLDCQDQLHTPSEQRLTLGQFVAYCRAVRVPLRLFMQEFDARNPGTLQPERLAVLNHVGEYLHKRFFGEDKG